MQNNEQKQSQSSTANSQAGVSASQPSSVSAQYEQNRTQFMNPAAQKAVDKAFQQYDTQANVQQTALSQIANTNAQQINEANLAQQEVILATQREMVANMQAHNKASKENNAFADLIGYMFGGTNNRFYYAKRIEEQQNAIQIMQGNIASNLTYSSAATESAKDIFATTKAYAEMGQQEALKLLELQMKDANRRQKENSDALGWARLALDQQKFAYEQGKDVRDFNEQQRIDTLNRLSKSGAEAVMSAMNNGSINEQDARMLLASFAKETPDQTGKPEDVKALADTVLTTEFSKQHNLGKGAMLALSTAVSSVDQLPKLQAEVSNARKTGKNVIRVGGFAVPVQAVLDMQDAMNAKLSIDKTNQEAAIGAIQMNVTKSARAVPRKVNQLDTIPLSTADKQRLSTNLILQEKLANGMNTSLQGIGKEVLAQQSSAVLNEEDALLTDALQRTGLSQVQQTAFKQLYNDGRIQAKQAYDVIVENGAANYTSASPVYANTMETLYNSILKSEGAAAGLDSKGALDRTKLENIGQYLLAGTSISLLDKNTNRAVIMRRAIEDAGVTNRLHANIVSNTAQYLKNSLAVLLNMPVNAGRMTSSEFMQAVKTNIENDATGAKRMLVQEFFANAENATTLRNTSLDTALPATVDEGSLFTLAFGNTDPSVYISKMSDIVFNSYAREFGFPSGIESLHSARALPTPTKPPADIINNAIGG
jgi:hypothetical protein